MLTKDRYTKAHVLPLLCKPLGPFNLYKMHDNFSLNSVICFQHPVKTSRQRGEDFESVKETKPSENRPQALVVLLTRSPPFLTTVCLPSVPPFQTPPIFHDFEGDSSHLPLHLLLPGKEAVFCSFFHGIWCGHLHTHANVHFPCLIYLFYQVLFS